MKRITSIILVVLVLCTSAAWVSGEPSAEQATVTVSYGVERFDPAEEENELSYKVLKASVEELSYEYDPAADYANAIRVRIWEDAQRTA